MAHRAPVTHGSPWVTDWRGESVTQALTWKWTLCLFPRSQRWLLCPCASPYNVLSAGFACRPYVNDDDEAGLEHLWSGAAVTGSSHVNVFEHFSCARLLAEHTYSPRFISLSGAPVLRWHGARWSWHGRCSLFRLFARIVLLFSLFKSHSLDLDQLESRSIQTNVIKNFTKNWNLNHLLAIDGGSGST